MIWVWHELHTWVWYVEPAGGVNGVDPGVSPREVADLCRLVRETVRHSEDVAQQPPGADTKHVL